MVAGILIPLHQLRQIYELIFRDGTLVAIKNRKPNSFHPELPGITNLQVTCTMRSLKSRGLVRETYCWRHHYWYLTNEGIAYVRDYLHLPPEIVPATLRRTAPIMRGVAAAKQPAATRGRGRGVRDDDQPATPFQHLSFLVNLGQRSRSRSPKN
uniref:Plectin/eS10 N-terminal domain-containing protein n=1 Tax=Eptatretus burgeri TaxID=7764 RepID=A0A8C4R5J7_EPTBU